MTSPAAGDPLRTVLLRLAITLVVGAAAGGAVLLLTFLEMGGAPGSDDVAYSLAGGSAALVIGISIAFAVPVRDPLARFKPVLVALLLGTGLALLTLGLFSWLQDTVFPYRRYRDLNYLVGEIGGYSAPGIGLLTCGLLLAWSYYVQSGTGLRLRSWTAADVPNADAAQTQVTVLGFLAPLLLASMLGVGVGLLNAALTYVVLGTRGSTSVLAGFLACGLGCLAAGIAFLLLCVVTNNLTWLSRFAGTFFVLTGLALCGLGILKWIA